MLDAMTGAATVGREQGGVRRVLGGVGERHVVGLLVVLCALPMTVLAVLRHHSYLPMGDEPHYLIISQALAMYQSLDVQRIYDNHDYWAFYPLWIEPHTSPGPGGRPLPLHSIGGPILWLIPFMVWGRAGALAFTVAVSLLVVVNVYWLARQLDVGRRLAFGVALAFGVGTPILTYSSMSFVEPIGALVCVYALRVLHRSDLRTADLVLASVGLGVLPWVHSRFLLFPPLFLAFLLARLLRERRPDRTGRVLLAIVPAAVLLLGLEVYNLVVWHTLHPAPNQANLGAVPFQADPLPALAGTALDQEAGVIPNFPIFLFVLPGVVFSLSRRYLSLHVHVLAAVVPYTVMVCSFPAWDGAWSPPARFMAVVLPMLACYVAIALRQARQPIVHALAAAAAAFGAVLTSLALFTPDGGFSAQRGHSLPLELLGDLIGLNLVGLVPSSAGDGQQLLFAGWLAGMVAFAAVVWLLGRGRRGDRSGRTPHPGADRLPSKRSSP